MRPASLVAFLLLLLVAAAHILRVAFGVEIMVEGTRVPQWPSLLGAVVFGATAFYLWKNESGD